MKRSLQWGMGPSTSSGQGWRCALSRAVCATFGVWAGFASPGFGQTGGEFRINSAMPDGRVTLSGAFANGVAVLERANALETQWQPVKNVFTTASSAQVSLVVTGATEFYRAQALNLAGGRLGFTNLTRAYGLLTTIAGAGGPQDVNN